MHARARPRAKSAYSPHKHCASSYLFHSNRLREEVKDANGNIALLTQRTINTLNRVAALTSAQGHTTQFGFDANGRTVSRTDAQNHTTSHSLDALSQFISATDPLVA